jgi:hypothetical protein
MNNSEACRQVGINRRTGTRWRFGRTVTVEDGRVHHYPAVPVPVRRELGCRYLSERERTTIADLRRTGATLRAIGVELGRSPATISRELRRNADPVTGKDRPLKAERIAALRRGRRRGRRPGPRWRAPRLRAGKAFTTTGGVTASTSNKPSLSASPGTTHDLKNPADTTGSRLACY